MTRPPRLLSLDLYRGLMVIAMMMVDWPGSWDTRFAIFEHATWTGVTPPDFIFPSFLFIMGAAVPLSIARQTPAHIVRRAVILFAVGYLLNIAGQPPDTWHLGNFRVLGVLQRFALVYPFVALATRHLSPRGRAYLTAGILLGYWALLALCPVPGFGHPDLWRHPEGEVTPNLAAWVDRAVLGHRVYEYPFDPEGILSTIPAIATGLIGSIAGQWLAATRRVERVFAWGAGLLATGAAWGLVFPLCKKLWSSSFVALTAGFSLLLLGALFWLVELRGRRGRLMALPLWYGANPLAALVAFYLIDDVTAWIRTGRKADGSPQLLKDTLNDALFRSWLPDRHASWVFSVVAILLLSLLFRALYRRRIFIRS